MNIDPGVLEGVSPLALVLVFLGGVVTSIGPCNMLMVPLIVGYVGGKTNLPRIRLFMLSFTFAMGLAITFTLLGVIATLFGGLVGGTSSLWFYVVAAACIIIAVQILAELPLPQLFPWIGEVQNRFKAKGIPGALGLGLVSGLVASQCATPVLAAIITYVMAQQGAVAYGALLLFVYALGRGVPIVLAGTFTALVKQMSAIERWMPFIEKASGVVILLVGLYFLWIA